ncbi:unnamed protein product [Effrenium voratum]|nr:unnamed protein product [Effrenium voratum]
MSQGTLACGAKPANNLKPSGKKNKNGADNLRPWSCSTCCKYGMCCLRIARCLPVLAYVGMFCAPGSQEDEDNQVFQLLEACSASHGLGYAGRWYWCALNSLTASDWVQPLAPGCFLISEGLQERLLWLCTPEELTPRALEALEPLLAQLGLEPVAEKFWRLLQVWRYNSFEFSDDPPSSALYLQASFHSHDCDPNANWVSDGKLVLRARRPVSAGEEVTISYLSDEELFESTKERRMRLRLSKAFECRCQRCELRWDQSRGMRCACGALRYLASDGGGEASACETSGCQWTPGSDILQREDLLVRLCRTSEDAAAQAAAAQRFAGPAEQLLPRHWATECLWKWLAKGCSTKLEAKQCEEKRLQFLQEAYDGAVCNSHTAWVMQSLAMWTFSLTGILKEDPAEECWAEARQSGALALLQRAAEILRQLNGDDRYHQHVQSHLLRIQTLAGDRL